MKKYYSIEVSCRKKLTLTEVFAFLTQSLKHNRNLFEFQNLYDKINIDATYSVEFPTKMKEAYMSAGLDKYSFTVVHEHLKQSKYYYPARDDRRMVSNLDLTWERANPYNNDNVDNEEFEKIILFADKLKRFDASSLMICFDEIEWGDEKPDKGTYGYEKVKSYHYLGEAYCSDCLIIGRIAGSTQYTAYLICESKYRDSNNVKNAISFLGEIKKEKIMYAPCGPDERSVWDKKYNEAEKMVAQIESNCHSIISSFPDNVKERTIDFINPQKLDKINIRKLIKEILCTEGWIINTNRELKIGTSVSKKKGDGLAEIVIDSLEGGHHIQVLLMFSSIYYSFTVDSLNYSKYPIDEENVLLYLQNIKKIRDYIDMKMS